MYKKLFFILFLGILAVPAIAETAGDCRSLMLDFIQKADHKENTLLIKNNWNDKDKKQFLNEVKELGFSDVNIKIMIESLNMQKTPVTVERV